MNKTWTFMLLTLILIILTVIVDSIGYQSTDINIGQQGFSWSTRGIGSLAPTYFRLMTFRIEGLPALFTLFIIYPITFGITFIVAEFVVEFLKVVSNLIPFT